MRHLSEAAEHLSQVPMFAGLDTETLEALADQSTSRSFNSGDSVAQTGAPNDGLLVIVEGALEVHRRGRLFKVLGAGDYVGDMSLLDGAPHMVDVVATSDGRGVFLAGHQFQIAVKHYPQVALEVIRVLVARLRETVGWLEEADEKAGTQPD